MRFSEKLADQRRRQGLSQEQLADRLGVTRQSVSKWESGAAMPELNKLVALSELFGVSVDYLVKDWMEEAERESGGEALPDASAARIERKLDDLTPRYKIYHYSSKRRLFGLPLVDIRFSHDRHPCRENTAVGVLAIGNFAVGVVSIGLLSAGVISVGMVTLGLLALGMVAVGGLAVGMTTLGVLSLGMASVGIYAFGTSALGAKLAVGLAANGAVAVGQGSVSGAQTLLTEGNLSPEQVTAFLRLHLEDVFPPLRRVLLTLAGWFAP